MANVVLLPLLMLVNDNVSAALSTSSSWATNRLVKVICGVLSGDSSSDVLPVISSTSSAIPAAFGIETSPDISAW